MNHFPFPLVGTYVTYYTVSAWDAKYKKKTANPSISVSSDMSDTIQSISKAIPDEEAGSLYLYILDPSQSLRCNLAIIY